VYWVITIMLMFHGTHVTLESEYTVKNFEDDWSCHKYVYENKIELIEHHIIKYGKDLRSFELYCESRYADEV